MNSPRTNRHIWFSNPTKPTYKNQKGLDFPTLEKKNEKLADLDVFHSFVINWQVNFYKSMKATFGEYIRQHRTDSGMTLTELAALLKLDSANLSKIENGVKRIEMPTLHSHTHCQASHLSWACRRKPKHRPKLCKRVCLTKRTRDKTLQQIWQKI